MSLTSVKARMVRACADAGRAPSEITLVAVSKGVPMERLAPLLEGGQRVFGENRVQEADAKWSPQRERFPDTELHLTGPLQTNKVRAAVRLFDVVETLDRARLADALSGLQAEGATLPRLFVQVNTGEEPQKSGVLPRETRAFVAQCRAARLAIDGLMCVPPVADDPAPHFGLLAQLAKAARVAHLSMGMSADFDRAILLGATHIRVGRALFT